jgi:hypothetical protein
MLLMLACRRAALVAAAFLTLVLACAAADSSCDQLCARTCGAADGQPADACCASWCDCALPQAGQQPHVRFLTALTHTALHTRSESPSGCWLL